MWSNIKFWSHFLCMSIIQKYARTRLKKVTATYPYRRIRTRHLYPCALSSLCENKAIELALPTGITNNPRIISKSDVQETHPISVHCTLYSTLISDLSPNIPKDMTSKKLNSSNTITCNGSILRFTFSTCHNSFAIPLSSLCCHFTHNYFTSFFSVSLHTPHLFHFSLSLSQTHAHFNSTEYK